MSMSGIEPLSKAYESFVLPLNYTDNIINISDFRVAGFRIALKFQGYEPRELLLLYPANRPIV